MFNPNFLHHFLNVLKLLNVELFILPFHPQLLPEFNNLPFQGEDLSLNFLRGLCIFCEPRTTELGFVLLEGSDDGIERILIVFFVYEVLFGEAGDCFES